MSIANCEECHAKLTDDNHVMMFTDRIRTATGNEMAIIVHLCSKCFGLPTEVLAK